MNEPKPTLREVADKWTVEQIETCVAKAVVDRDMPALDALLHLLVVKDPHRAATMYDTLRLGLNVARQRLQAEAS
jgi:hypothetical protein